MKDGSSLVIRSPPKLTGAALQPVHDAHEVLELRAFRHLADPAIDRAPVVLNPGGEQGLQPLAHAGVEAADEFPMSVTPCEGAAGQGEALDERAGGTTMRRAFRSPMMARTIGSLRSVPNAAVAPAVIATR